MTVTSSTGTARPERFYTVPEAALLLKASQRTVRKAIRAGELAATRWRRQYRIPAEAIARMEAEAMAAGPTNITELSPANPSQPLNGGEQP